MANWQRVSTSIDSHQEAETAASRWHWLLQIWEQETARIAIWSPVLLVGGIWTYFSLAKEPPVLLGLLLTLVTAYVLVFQRHKKSMLIAALLALGFVAAQWRTQWVATPLIGRFTPAVVIEGHVVDAERRGPSRQKLVVAVTKADGLLPEETPLRMLLQVNAKTTLPRIGDKIRVKADLAPLPRPSMAGAFDYGRQLYFQSIGTSARTRETPQVIMEESVPWSYAVRRGFHALRNVIGSKVRAAISGPIGAFADALITGERTAIPRAMVNSLQTSGLFHILSISGLHMSLVAGGAFWVVRALLALFPLLALRYPIKKWAAAIATLVGFAYMLLADGGAATERSFIMIAVVFFAVMVDRPALSLHNLAVAAVLILLTAPEQALAASFQMSFMAVMGLAGFFAWWQHVVPIEEARIKVSGLQRFLRKAFRIVIASLVTSIIAGALSSIPAAHHFGRLAPYSVVANALALPVVGMIVMPMAMLSVLLMPIGLESLPLKAMELGLQLVMLISDWVASWPQAGTQLPRLSAQSAALLALGVATICLSISRLRLLSLPLFCAAAASIWFMQRPDILIDERASNVAINTNLGLVPAEGTKSTFSVGRWLDEYGDTLSAKKAALRPGWICAAGQCTATLGTSQITFQREEGNALRPCPKTEILIASYPLRFRCKGRLLTIDRFDVWRNGAHVIWISNGKAVMQTVRQSQGERAWVYQPKARSKQTPIGKE